MPETDLDLRLKRDGFPSFRTGVNFHCLTAFTAFLIQPGIEAAQDLDGINTALVINRDPKQNGPIAFLPAFSQYSGSGTYNALGVSMLFPYWQGSKGVDKVGTPQRNSTCLVRWLLSLWPTPDSVPS